MSKENEEEKKNTSSETPSMNNNEPAPRWLWIDFNLQRAQFSVRSASAPHLKHSLSNNTRTNQDSSSTVKPKTEAATSSNSGANELPEWAEPLEDIYKVRMNSGMPIRDAVKKAIARGPPAVVTEKPQQSISREVYKSNNATRTKKMALEVLHDAQSGMFKKY